jgi:nickel/cobalt exporter
VRKLVGILGLALLLIPKPAAAHPMGNFSINVHLGIAFEESAVTVTLIVDMAEIPTFQEKDIIDSSGDGQVSASERLNYAADACSRYRDDIDISLDGIPTDLNSDGATLDLLPGAAGLEIMRLSCDYQLELAKGDSGQLKVTNRVYEGRIGWREMTATAQGFALETDVPVESPSEQLTVFPPGPVEDRSTATVDYTRENGALLAAPPRTFVERLGTNLEVGWLALLTAVGLGAAHALAPGHGKTLMAAYLVGRRGRIRHAAGLGLAVALSHTLGVGILGIVTVLTTSRFEPDRIYPWLSIASAALVTAIGGAMLVRALRAQTHDHDHGSHGRGHSHEGTTDRPLGWRSLAALGLAGGLVPSASAVVLLLGAVSQGDPWFGLGLVAAFGSGMAIALVAAGIAAIWAVRLGWRFISHDRRRQRLERLVPALAGGSVTLVGIVLLLQAATAWS